MSIMTNPSLLGSLSSISWREIFIEGLRHGHPSFFAILTLRSVWIIGDDRLWDSFNPAGNPGLTRTRVPRYFPSKRYIHRYTFSKVISSLEGFIRTKFMEICDKISSIRGYISASMMLYVGTYRHDSIFFLKVEHAPEVLI